MNVFKRCSKYTRLSNATVMRFPFVVMSYATVTLCVYGTIVAGYLFMATSFLEMRFLQYWLILSLIINGFINMSLFLHRNKIESHEIVYELKMLHAMYFGNALLHYNMTDTEQVSMLITNLVHCCGLALLFVELVVLLGHALGIYSDYRYVKVCYLLIMFMIVVIIVMTGGSNVKTAPICDDLIMAALLSVTYLLIAIVWATRKEIANLQQTVLFNEPPPPFTTMEMEDFSKVKV